MERQALDAGLGAQDPLDLLFAFGRRVGGQRGGHPPAGSRQASHLLAHECLLSAKCSRPPRGDPGADSKGAIHLDISVLGPGHYVHVGYSGLCATYKPENDELAPPGPASQLGDPLGRLYELGEVVGEVVEVLAQPHAVVGAGADLDDVLWIEPRRLERGARGAGPVEDLGETAIPRRQRVRAALDRGACRLEGDRVAGEAGDGVGCEPEPQGTADETPQVLLGDPLRALLGEEPAQGIVEAKPSAIAAEAPSGSPSPRPDVHRTAWAR